MKARPVIANYNEISQAMGQAIEAVLLGKAQPQQALDQAAQQVDQTLASGQTDRSGGTLGAHQRLAVRATGGRS